MSNLVKAGIAVLLVAGVAEWASHRGTTTTDEGASERGAALFTTKGCVTCHIHGRAKPVKSWDAAIGPDLTNYTNDPAYLRRWLAQPSAVRAATMMPDLDLSAPDIEDLIVFLNTTPN